MSFSTSGTTQGLGYDSNYAKLSDNEDKQILLVSGVALFLIGALMLGGGRYMQASSRSWVQNVGFMTKWPGFIVLLLGGGALDAYIKIECGDE